MGGRRLPWIPPVARPERGSTPGHRPCGRAGRSSVQPPLHKRVRLPDLPPPRHPARRAGPALRNAAPRPAASVRCGSGGFPAGGPPAALATLAVHMHRSLGGWPERIGPAGFPPALLLHHDLAGLAFSALILDGMFGWPLTRRTALIHEGTPRIDRGIRLKGREWRARMAALGLGCSSFSHRVLWSSNIERRGVEHHQREVRRNDPQRQGRSSRHMVVVHQGEGQVRILAGVLRASCRGEPSSRGGNAG